jgi:predicted amidohydrolase YtcJ
MLLTNLNIWDGVSDSLDPVADSLMIEGEKILGVARTTTNVPVGDSKVQDMQGLYVIPGLIDAHVHMCLDPDIRDPFAQDQFSDDELIKKIEQRAPNVNGRNHHGS